MANLLHLDSSAKGSMSVTRPVTQYFAELWQEKHRDGESRLPRFAQEQIEVRQRRNRRSLLHSARSAHSSTEDHTR